MSIQSRALTSAQAREDMLRRQFCDSNGNSATKEKKQRAWEVAKYIREVVEKNEPKKVDLTDYGVVAVAFCPSCKTAIEVGDMFCRKCGQALDWSNAK